MGIVPDGKMVEVIFRAYGSHHQVLDRKMVTRLEPFGIKGLFVLGLEEMKPGDIEKSPKIAFPTEYVDIPSSTRGIQKRTQILALNEKVDKILEHMMGLKSENKAQ